MSDELTRQQVAAGVAALERTDLLKESVESVVCRVYRAMHEEARPDPAPLSYRINYREIMRAEQSPDVYAGPRCDEHRPRWVGSAEGDRDGDSEVGEPDGAIRLSPNHYPPGTRVMVMVPCCPECGTPADNGSPPCGLCGFPWKSWANDQYS